LKKTATPKTEIHAHMKMIPVLFMSSRFLGPDFDSLTRVHFALYSCTVAAFLTRAASICTVTPETVVFRGDRKAVIFKDDREAVHCPCRAGSRSGLGWPQSLPLIKVTAQRSTLLDAKQ